MISEVEEKGENVVETNQGGRRNGNKEAMKMQERKIGRENSIRHTQLEMNQPERCETTTNSRTQHFLPCR